MSLSPSAVPVGGVHDIQILGGHSLPKLKFEAERVSFERTVLFPAWRFHALSSVS